MTGMSMPICLSSPLGYRLPEHLEAFSPASNYLREIKISNAVCHSGLQPPLEDCGGEDFSINLLAHDGMPAVEVSILQCPNRALKQKLQRCVKPARYRPAAKTGARPAVQLADAVLHEELLDTSPQPEICQVSTNVDETLEMLLKLMPGGRLNDLQKHELAAVLSKHHQVFAKHSKDYGKLSGQYEHEHTIDIEADKADKCRRSQKPYRHSHFEGQFLKEMVHELHQAGLIRPSSSAWMSPVVKKKDGSLRMCIDFRQLNSVTKRDAYPLPRIDSLTDRMKGCNYFTSVDVLSAFWNVPMAEDSIDKTGFTTALGNYEWTRMPFGPANASSTFQRVMDSVASGLQHTATYIDDVFLFTKTWEEHLKALDETLARLSAPGMKCKLSKCAFAGDSVKCLGHLVTPQGVTLDDDKVQAIMDLPVPRDVTDVRSFLGVVQYFAQFIEGHAHISEALVNLTRKGVPWDWTDECQKAFVKLKRKLAEKPVLAVPDFTPGKGFTLYTDWSKTAIGAVLTQQDGEGLEHPVAYASRILTRAERNYAPTEGECLAIVWSVKKFRHHLHGRPFLLRTDHHALQWLQTARFSNSKLERWSMALQEHDYRVEYLKGKHNMVADCLSRVVANAVQAHEVYLTQQGLAHITSAEVDLDDLSKTEHGDLIRCAICNDPAGAANMAFCSGCNRPFHLRCVLPPIATVPIGEWYCLECDSSAGQLHELEDANTCLQLSPTDLYANPMLMECLASDGREHALPYGPARLSIRRMLRYVRKHPTYPGWLQVKTRRNKWRTSPPLFYRWEVIRMYHDMLGHAGIEHTHRILAQQVYWPGMKKDVAGCCMACIVCQQRKVIMYEQDTMENTKIHGALPSAHSC